MYLVTASPPRPSASTTRLRPGPSAVERFRAAARPQRGRSVRGLLLGPAPAPGLQPLVVALGLADLTLSWRMRFGERGPITEAAESDEPASPFAHAQRHRGAPIRPAAVAVAALWLPEAILASTRITWQNLREDVIGGTIDGAPLRERAVEVHVGAGGEPLSVACRTRYDKLTLDDDASLRVRATVLERRSFGADLLPGRISVDGVAGAVAPFEFDVVQLRRGR